MSTKRAVKTEWSVGELYENLRRSKDFFVFDVRAEDEFEVTKIEGKEALPIKNVPYYEMLEFDEFDDVAESFKAFLETGTAETLPKGVTILVVCAKGDTSEYVAEALRRLGFDAANLSGGMIAWADYYAVASLVEGDSTIYQVSRPARGCLSHVAVSQGKAVVIDPLRHYEHYLELAEANGFEIVLVLDTHGHADHISGGPGLAAKLGLPYHLHPYDGIHPIDVLPATLEYEYLYEGRKFAVGGKTLETLHVPGHTLGNSVFLWGGNILFSGDSIFIESIARPDLGGHGDTWAPLHYASLRRLLGLPESTLVMPGHFSGLGEAGEDGFFSGRLEALAASNVDLAAARKEEHDFVAFILASLPEFPDEYVDIKRVNAGLLEVGESRASELEIGKNVCALAKAHE